MRLASCGVLWAIALATGACAGPLKSDADKLIAKTRETNATYSLFLWNEITHPDGKVDQEWSAEFHQGTLHRVETPRDRIVADCAAGTGIYLRVPTKEIIRGPNVAKAACGIQANSEIIESRVLSSGSGPFGPAVVVLVRDPENIRTYTVAESGALIASTIDDLESRRLITANAVALLPTAAGDIFTEASLAASAVPEKYRSKPNR